MLPGGIASTKVKVCLPLESVIDKEAGFIDRKLVFTDELNMEMGNISAPNGEISFKGTAPQAILMH